MHGGGGEKRKGTRHMWKAPTRGDSSLNADVSSSSSSSSSTVKSFCKDGCKISVGDCALFKPSEDRPPFIGIIRYLKTGKENKLKLGVSWLYRSIEVKLSKGVALKAAPNEIFYTFHKDEIDAESLLHPCKVAFLPKGAELPSGISSFVCRRVYDIAKKCLWWLNDQDYINDCQEEVDQLLYRTCVEMHATVQPGGRSPKPMNSPTSASQLKSVSDSLQNSASSFPSHIKGRKRERVDQGSEPIKRERSMKTEDGDSGNFRHDNILKTEIAKITEKGGLVDSEGVEKLVQLMVPDRNEKKIDLASRSLLAAVIAATDKSDCLSQFVQLKGLPVFDEWLQEVHKGKIGDVVVSRDGDKSVEEFLFVMLRALDKLPVNLQALQTCNIGKSVNHLRTYKNTEIQRKARGLVDTWKKRVEAEMNMHDGKSGSGPTVYWHAKSRSSDVGHGGNRHSGSSSDVAMKSSVTQLSASKTASVKIVQGENTNRSASTSAFPGPAKSVPSPASAATNIKDGQPRIAAVSGGSDLPTANARDEKSSSSSQSHNNSQSCSSDHAKTGGLSGKEDARSSTAMSANKISGGSARHRKSINGFSGSTPSGSQRETGSSRNSSHRNLTSEKISQPGLMEKTLDGTSHEGNPKLIVKIPNQGRSPAQSASAGSFDDPTIMNSRASSPVLPEKHDQFDHASKEKNDFYRANIGSDINTESWQSNDFKDVLTGSDEGDGSPAAVTDEERCRTGDDCKKTLEVSKAGSSSSGNENKGGNLRDASYSSINALIEGVKYSEADDVGMNLLASVATGEMLKSESLNPAGSPERNTAVVEQSCTSNGVVKSSEENLVRDECHSNNGLDGEHQKQGPVTGDLGANDENDSAFQASGAETARELNKHANACSMDLQHVAETISENNEKFNEKSVPSSMDGLPESTAQEARDGDRSKQPQEEIDQGVNAGESFDAKVSCVMGVEAEATEKLAHIAVEVDAHSGNCTAEGSSGGGQTAKTPPAILMQSDSARGKDEISVDKVPEDFTEQKADKADDVDAETLTSQSKKQRNECENDALTMPENKGLCTTVTGLAAEHVEENLEVKEVHDQHAKEVLPKDASNVCTQEADKHLDSKVSKLTAVEAQEAEECTSTTADASSMSVVAVSEADAKVEFDLNEGLNADDGKCGEFNSIATSGCAPTGQLISPMPFPVSSMSCGIPAPVTVAAAAKGPFVPPEDLLRSKGEIGWKGSAATSAFRPAEPRKVLEMPLGTLTSSIPDAVAGKKSRVPLDIDLNVPDERILDDVSSQVSARHVDSSSLAADGHDRACSKMSSPARCFGGLGLDLNQVDEASDIGNCSTSSNHKIDVPIMQVKSSLGGPPSREVNVHRDFDLNDGPTVDELTTESSLFSQHASSSLPSQPPVSGFRLNTAETGNFSSWLPSSGNTYSAVTISSIMPDRVDQPFSIVAPNGPQRMLTPAAAGNPFGPDIYRGPVLSSSPAVPSYASAPFEYPVFPFNSSFPLPSASFSAGSTTYIYPTSGNRLCFPAVNSQLMGPAGTVSSHYPRPYVVGLTESSNSGSAETSRKWARQGLDLNAGPGGSEIEGRDESLSLPSRQLSVASSQALAEDHARIQMAGSVRKRKEPDGGWDGYNQSSWQ